MELQLEIAAAKAGVSLAKSQSQPSVLFRGQLTEQTPTAFIHEHYAAAMLEIRLPILDNGKTKLDTREARAQVGRLEALLEDAKAGISLDVSRAWDRMQHTRELIKLAEIRAKGAAAQLKVAETAYSVGRASSVEVTAARRESRLAQEKQNDAAADDLRARKEFLNAEGNVLPQVDAEAPLPALLGGKR
jgi:outer membrane protein TolC